MKRTIISGAAIAILMTGAASVNAAIDNTTTLPNAKPGECYAKVVIPAQYRSETTELVVKQAAEKIEVIPAKYEWTTERVLVKEASKNITPVAATYGTETQTVETSPATRAYSVAAKRNSAPASPSNIAAAKAAGIKVSVMVINGMGGKRYSKQHAINSAKLVNATQPEYLATLVLFDHEGKGKIEQGFDNDFTHLNTAELCEEMRSFIQHTELDKSIFRSDHVSNHLILKGVLGKDKDNMLEDIDDAIAHFKAHPEIQHRPSSF